MNILQLCFFTDLWHSKHSVTSIDIKTGIDILTLSDDVGKEFDFIVAAPPCDQFTLAAAWMWEKYPDYFIKVAKKCYQICINSGKEWIYENPPGRIEKFLPELKPYRIMTWQSSYCNKQYVIYSNLLFMTGHNERYGHSSKVHNQAKKTREAWLPELVKDIEIILHDRPAEGRSKVPCEFIM